MNNVAVSTHVADLYRLNTRGFGTHQAMLELVTPGSRVLDVGCAAGLLGALLRHQRSAHVVGLETDADAGALAQDRLDAVIIGDATQPSVQTQVAALGPFDHIVLGDVLEHIPEPLPVLDVFRPLLAPDGSFVISLPNIVTLSARLRLLRGVWKYEDTGIFDRTHLRFFDVVGMRALLADAGLRVRKELPVGPLTHRLGRSAVRATGWRPGLLATQVIFDAVPADLP